MIIIEHAHDNHRACKDYEIAYMNALHFWAYVFDSSI